MESKQINEIFNLGKESITNNDFNTALEHFLILKNVLLDANYYIGFCYFKLNQYEKSLEYLTILEIDKNKSNNLDAKLNDLMGYLHLKLDNYEKAIIYYTKAKELGINNNNILGRCYYYLNKYELSLYYYLLALDDINEDKSKTLYNIGNVYFMMKDYVNANKFYEESKEQGSHLANFGIGNCYMEQKQYDKGLNYYILALEQNEKLKIDNKIINFINEAIGNSYIRLEKPSCAIVYYIKAFSGGYYSLIFKIIKILYILKFYEYVIKYIFKFYKKFSSDDYLLLGYSYYNINNLQEAKKYFELALNDNCEKALTNLKPYIKIDTDNKYTIDINKMYMVKTLISLSNTNTNINTNINIKDIDKTLMSVNNTNIDTNINCNLNINNDISNSPQSKKRDLSLTDKPLSNKKSKK